MSSSLHVEKHLGQNSNDNFHLGRLLQRFFHLEQIFQNFLVFWCTFSKHYMSIHRLNFFLTGVRVKSHFQNRVKLCVHPIEFYLIHPTPPKFRALWFHEVFVTQLFIFICDNFKLFFLSLYTCNYIAWFYSQHTKKPSFKLKENFSYDIVIWWQKFGTIPNLKKRLITATSVIHLDFPTPLSPMIRILSVVKTSWSIIITIKTVEYCQFVSWMTQFSLFC